MKQLFALLLTISALQAQPIIPVPTGPETQVTRTLKTNATHQGWRDALDVPGYAVWSKDVSAAARFSNSLTVSNTPGSGKTNYVFPNWHVEGGLSVAQGYKDLRDFGAVEGDGSDRFTEIQTAVDYCVANDLALLWLGDYASSQTITLPDGIRIFAMPMDMTYKVNPRGVQGGSLTMLANVTAFQTARLTAPNDTIGFWARDINIQNLYIKGTQVHADSETASVGLDLTGCYASRFAGHIEGFGTAILAENVAELDLADSIIQNCYNGIVVRRDPPDGGRVYDAIVNILNVLNINNRIPLILDNVRYVGVFGGEIISNITNTGPVKVVNTRDDSTIVFHGMKAFENQSHTALIVVDTNGLGNLSMEKCNSAVNNFNQPIVDISGYFNSIKVTDNQLQRTTGTNKIAPIVWARRPPSDENNYVRGNIIEVHGNDPHWFDAFVRNDQLMSSIENDYLPPGYIPLNPVPGGATGIAGNDGVISVAGNYAFTTTSINANGKIYWQDAVATNNVYSLLTPIRLTKGFTHLYGIAVVYDNDENDIPVLNVQGWGAQGEWNRISQAKIGSYTNSTTGIVFSKWAWCVTVQNQSKATNGLSHVQLFNIFGVDSSDPNRSDYGLETFRVYGSKKENHYGPVFQEIAGFPTTGLEGYGFKNQIKFNNYTTNQSIVAFVPRSFTQTLDWNTIGNAYTPDSQGQFELPYFSKTSGGALGRSGVYGSLAGQVLAIGTSSTAAASRLVLAYTTNTLPMIWLGNTGVGVNRMIQMSDDVDYSIQQWMDSVNNKYMFGETTNHVVLAAGNVGIGHTPAFDFDVLGQIRALGDNAGLFLQNSTTNEPLYIAFRNFGGGSDRGQVGYISSGNPTRLYVNNNFLGGIYLTDTTGVFADGFIHAPEGIFTNAITLNGDRRTAWPSGTLPADAAGWLENDGAGNLSWTTPPGGGGNWVDDGATNATLPGIGSAHELIATNKLTAGIRLDFLNGASVYRNGAQFATTDANFWYWAKGTINLFDSFIADGADLTFTSDVGTTVTANIDSATGNITADGTLFLGTSTNILALDNSAGSKLISTNDTELRLVARTAAGTSQGILLDTGTTVWTVNAGAIYPDAPRAIGTAPNPISELVASTSIGFDDGIAWFKDSTSPETSVTAPVGSLYSRTDGGAGTTLYVKESGTGNTGWVAVSGGGGGGGTVGTMISSGTIAAGDYPKASDTTGTNYIAGLINESSTQIIVKTNFVIKGSSAAGALAAFVVNTNALIVTNAGSSTLVGIGKLPTAALDIVGAITASGGITSSSFLQAAAAGEIRWSGRSFTKSTADGNFTIGANASSTPVTFKVGDNLATTTLGTIRAGDGVGTDKSGGNLSTEGGIGTGTGRGGDLLEKTSITTTTGSSAQSQSVRRYVSAKFVDLTESTDTLTLNITCAASKHIGGKVHYTISADDGIDFQSTEGMVAFAAVNKAGTVSVPGGNLTGIAEITGASAGTLTSTWTAVANGNSVDLKCNAVSSLTQTTLRVQWWVDLSGNDVSTVTPQ